MTRRWTQLGMIAVVAGFAGSAQASVWELDTAHSNVDFTVKHMMVSNVRGTFREVVGMLNVDDKDMSKSSMNFTLQTASVDTHNEKRDGHLKSADFFDSAKWPLISYKSTSVKKDGKGLKVMGELTIRDVTKPVTLKVTEFSKPTKDPWGATKVGAQASAEIERKDFGLTWNKALDAGGWLVGEKVNLHLDVEFTQKDATTPATASAQ